MVLRINNRVRTLRLGPPAAERRKFVHMKRKLGFLDNPSATAATYHTGGEQKWTRISVHPSISVDRLVERRRIFNLAVVVDGSVSIYGSLDAIKELITGLPSALSASLLEPTDVNVVFVMAKKEEALVLNGGVFQSADKIDTGPIFKHLNASSLDLATCHSNGIDAAMNALTAKDGGGNPGTTNTTSVILTVSAFSPPTHAKDNKENLATQVDAHCSRHPVAMFALVCGKTSKIDYSLIDSIVGRRGCYAVVRRGSMQTDAVELFQKLSASLGCSRTTIIVSKPPPIEVDDNYDSDDENVDVNTPSHQKKRARRESATEKHYFAYEVGILTPFVAALGRSFLIDVPCDETSNIETVFSSSASNIISSSNVSVQSSGAGEATEDLDMWWKNTLVSIRNTCNVGLDVFTRVVNDIHEVPNDKTPTNRIKRFALKRLLDLMVTRSAVHSRRDLLDVARKDQARRRRVSEDHAAMANSRFGGNLFPASELPKNSLPGYGSRSCHVDDTNQVLDIRNALTCVSLCSV
jgi:ribosomal protein S27E